MNKRILVLLGLSLTMSLLLMGCSDKTASETSGNSPSASFESITAVAGIPENFNGCSCALARNKSEYDAQKFIYLESYGKIDPDKNIAMISLDGQEIIYPRKQPPQGLQVLVLYESKGGGKSDIRANQRTGKLVIKQENGATLKEEFFGVCGC
ncbi:MAG TPA: hypothetical protein VJ917_01500 [Saprospiraceae bacterium]|nr:hypothetical protein [Saprospiraceae bacterium]